MKCWFRGHLWILIERRDFEGFQIFACKRCGQVCCAFEEGYVR